MIHLQLQGGGHNKQAKATKQLKRLRRGQHHGRQSEEGGRKKEEVEVPSIMLDLNLHASDSSGRSLQSVTPITPIER